MTEKKYVEIKEAKTIIMELCKKYPNVLWAVKPENVIVLGIENKERGKKNKTLAKIISIRGVEKVIMFLNGINVQYAIEVFWSDWHLWTEVQRQWIIFHELLHISPDEGKTVKHDVRDFRLLVDVVGVDWMRENKSLPNLLNDTVKFNLDLRPGLDDLNSEDAEDVEDNKEEDK